MPRSGIPYLRFVFALFGVLAWSFLAGQPGAWRALGSGVRVGSPQGMVADDATGDVYVWGWFDEIGGVASKGVARWDGTAWHDITANSSQGYCGTSCFNIIREDFHDGNFYLAGQVGYIDSIPTPIDYLYSYNGTRWGAVDTLNGPCYVNESAGALFITGHFDSIGGRPTRAAAWWNGQRFQPIGQNYQPPYTFYYIEVHEGDTFMAGNFDDPVNGFHQIVYWDGEAYRSPGNGIPNDWVLKLKSYGGRLYAGGAFPETPDCPQAYLVAWNGERWERAFKNVELITQVRHMEVDDGKLYFHGAHYVWDRERWKGPFNFGRFDGNTLCSFGPVYEGDLNTGFYAGDFDVVNGRLYALVGTMTHFGDTLGMIGEYVGGPESEVCISQVNDPPPRPDVPTPPEGIWPNPVGEEMRVFVVLDSAADLEVVLHDALGRPIYRAQKPARAGGMTVYFPLDGIAAAPYFAEVRVLGAGGVVLRGWRQKILKL